MSGKSNIIEMHVLSRATAWVQRDNVYKLAPSGRFAKLWAWLYGKMLKHGQLHQFYEQVDSVDRITIDEADFSKRLYKYYTVACGGMYPKRPSQVYMGRDEFMQLSHNAFRDSDGFISFGMQLSGIRENGLTVGGIQVTVVPYMKGVLIV